MREIPIQAGRKAERGQALLEFAMIVPMLFLMLVGVAYFAMGFNLQQVLNGAVYEGARVWARNPAGGSSLECSLPKCNSGSQSWDPNAENNFWVYIAPVVRNYVSSHGFDGDKVKFYLDDVGMARNRVNALSRDPEVITITILYPYNLPIGNFAEKYLEVKVSATCTLKKG